MELGLIIAFSLIYGNITEDWLFTVLLSGFPHFPGNGIQRTYGYPSPTFTAQKLLLAIQLSHPVNHFSSISS